VLAVVGSYGLNQSLIDVWVMLIFGLLGFVLRRYGFSAAPIIMGLILGELVENTLKQSLLIFEHNWLLFFYRPIVDIFFTLTLVGLFGSMTLRVILRRLNRGKLIETTGE
jgi:putative tricarboxylic transport membrane protein